MPHSVFPVNVLINHQSRAVSVLLVGDEKKRNAESSFLSFPIGPSAHLLSQWVGLHFSSCIFCPFQQRTHPPTPEAAPVPFTLFAVFRGRLGRMLLIFSFFPSIFPFFFFLFCCLFVCLFLFFCNPVYPGTCSVKQAGLELREPPASAWKCWY